MSRISMIIDHREPVDNCLAILKNHSQVNVSVIQLQIGDYFINSKLLFERKTISDFARSIIDGRLFAQAQQLKISNIKSAIILEGNSLDAQKIGVSRQAMLGAVVKLSLSLGIPLLRSMHLEESLSLMMFAATQDLITNSSINSFPCKRKLPRVKRQAQLQILQALPDVGLHRAGVLLKHFGSVKAVTAAEQEQLQEVAGIGEKISKKIRWMVD